MKIAVGGLKKRIILIAGATVLVVAAVVGVWFGASRYRAYRLNATPIFQQLGDKTLSEASKKNRTRVVRLKSDGIENNLTLRETYCADNAVHVGFILEGRKPSHLAMGIFYKNREVLKSSSGSEKQVGKYEYFYEETFTPAVKLPQNAVVEVIFTDTDTHDIYRYQVPVDNGK